MTDEQAIEEAMDAIGGAHYGIVSRAIMEPILRDLVNRVREPIEKERDAARAAIFHAYYEYHPLIGPCAGCDVARPLAARAALGVTTEKS